MGAKLRVEKKLNLFGQAKHCFASPLDNDNDNDLKANGSVIVKNKTQVPLRPVVELQDQHLHGVQVQWLATSAAFLASSQNLRLQSSPHSNVLHKRLTHI